MNVSDGLNECFEWMFGMNVSNRCLEWIFWNGYFGMDFSNGCFKWMFQMDVSNGSIKGITESNDSLKERVRC